MIVDIYSIKPIEVESFGKCLLVETFPIIDSPFGWGGCVDMSRTIKLLYPNNSKNFSYLNQAKDNEDEYFEFAEHGAFYNKFVHEIGNCYIHNSFFETSQKSTNIGKAIDLGLSVLWADMNVGASDPSGNGLLFGYGDPTGEKWSEDENDYPKEAIVGTKNDIATANWGPEWRMPTAQELKELAEQCRWEPSMLNGVEGNIVTGPNGNSIFFPFAGSRIGVDTFRDRQMGECWAGSLSNFGSPVNMMFSDYSAVINWGACAAWGASVRPVKDKKL